MTPKTEHQCCKVSKDYLAGVEKGLKQGAKEERERNIMLIVNGTLLSENKIRNMLERER